MKVRASRSPFVVLLTVASLVLLTVQPSVGNQPISKSSLDRTPYQVWVQINVLQSSAPFRFAACGAEPNLFRTRHGALGNSVLQVKLRSMRSQSLDRFTLVDLKRENLAGPRHINQYPFGPYDRVPNRMPFRLDDGGGYCAPMCEGQWILATGLCLVGACGLFGNFAQCENCLAVANLGKALCLANCLYD
jgi:hypothetical protein